MDSRMFSESDDTARNIAALARQLQLPEAEVGIVYQRALRELAATARIHNYLGILAMNTARSILSNRTAAQTVH